MGIFVGVWCHCKSAVVFTTTLMVVAATVDEINLVGMLLGLIPPTSAKIGLLSIFCFDW